MQTYPADTCKHLAAMHQNLNMFLTFQSRRNLSSCTFSWFLSFILTRPSSCLSNKVAFKKWNVLQHTSSARQVLGSGQQPAAGTPVVAGAADADADAGDVDVDIEQR